MSQSSFLGCKSCGASFEARTGVSVTVEAFYGDGKSAGVFDNLLCSEACAQALVNESAAVRSNITLTDVIEASKVLHFVGEGNNGG